MTLVYDERASLAGQPVLHALIAGVSHYPHLPNGGGAPAPDSHGMEQLSSTALSAFRMYQWLTDHREQLAAKLATCRILLSPSAAELAAEPLLQQLITAKHVEPCTLATFQAAAAAWRDDASLSPADHTLFYFAGHGVQRSRGDQVLLLQDFGDGIGGTLGKAVTTKDLHHGMAPTNSRSEIATNQLYLVDACRVLPEKFANFFQLPTGVIWDIEFGGRDTRSAPIFYAAVPGSKAYAISGGQTLFSKALLTCLDGGAGEARDENGQQTWVVTFHSLSAALADVSRVINEQQKADQEFVIDGFAGRDVDFHLLQGTPVVDVILEIDPVDAVGFTSVAVVGHGLGTASLPPLPNPLDPHPFVYQIPAGVYTFNAVATPPYVTSTGEPMPVLPPHHRWKRRVSQ